MKKFLLLPALFLILSLSFAEDRIVKLDSDGDTPGELRYEINNSEPGDVIIIDEKVQNIVLEKGEIEVPHELHITGQEKAPTTITGNGTSRIFNFTQMEVPSQEGIFDVVLNKTHPGSLVEHLVLTKGLSKEELGDGEGGAVRLNNRSAFFRKVTFQENTSVGFGGAVCAFGGELIFEYCTFNNNNTAQSDKISSGGAIYYKNDDGGQSRTYSSFTLFGSTVTDNQSLNGPGGAVSIIDNVGGVEYYIENSTFYKNKGAGGGAFYLEDNSGESNGYIDQCTFSNNTDSEEGGGAIYVIDQGNLSINNSTITENNSEYSGGGIYTYAAKIQLNHTIVSNNSIGTNATSGTEDLYAEIPESITSRGFNFLGSNSFNVFGNINPNDIKGDDPQLEPLADNGGPTTTHMPKESSPVVDKGDPTYSTDMPDEDYDQRGVSFLRVSNKIVDIGSVEWSYTCPTTLAFDAGDDIQICADSAVFRVKTPMPTGYTGSWSHVGNENTPIIELGNGTVQVGPYIFNDTTQIIWTADNGLCSFNDTLVITHFQKPFVDIFGRDYCADTIFLSISPVPGDLTWSIIEGVGTITEPNKELTKLTNTTPGDSVKVELSVKNGICPIVRDTAVYSRQEETNPSINISNISTSLCNDSTQFFHANVNIKDYQDQQSDLSWVINGNEQDVIADTIASFKLNNGDTVSAVFDFFPACASFYSDTSNKIIVDLAPHTNAGNFNEVVTNICQGDSIIFEVSSFVGDSHNWYQSIDNGVTLVPLINGVIQDTIIRKPSPTNTSINEIIYYHEASNTCDTSITSITFNLNQKAVAGTIATATTTVCEGTSINLKLTNSTADYYEWEYYDGTSWSINENLTLDSINIIVTDTIMYRALAFPNDESACKTPDTSNSVTINVTPRAEPATITTANTTLCAMDSITLQYTGGIGTGKWFVSENGSLYTETLFPSMIGDSIASNVVFTNSGNTPIVYAVYVQTATSCDSSYSDTITITVNPKPILDSLSDVSACNQYPLPAITGTNLSGNEAYYSLPNGGGVKYIATDSITTTATIYLYDETGSTPNCIDEQTVTITIDSTTIINAGPDQTICANNPIILTATSSNSSTGTLWTTSGSGTFTPNATSINTQYTPSSQDIIAKTIVLTHTTTASGLCPNVSDALTLTITPAPTVNAGSDIIVCSENPTVTLNGSITNATGATWSGGLGSFSLSENSLNASYILTPFEIANNTVNLILTSTGNGICQAASDTVEISIQKAPSFNIINDQVACDSLVLPTISGTNLSGNEAYYLSPNGLGTTLTTGEFIRATTTVYVYDSSIANCSNETSFNITINKTPAIDGIADMVTCDSIQLPSITGSNLITPAFYTTSGGTGIRYSPGDFVSESTTLFIYDETATLPNCIDEISFNITTSTSTLSLVDDTVNVTAGSLISIPVTDNDMIGGVISLIKIINENPVTETATIQGDKVEYVSSNGIKGLVTLDYEVTDECTTDTARIFITVENSSPIAKDTVITLGDQSILTIDLTSLFTDEDNNVLINALAILTNPQSGATATITGSILELDYSSLTATNNSDIISIAVTDAGGDSDTINIEIIIGQYVVEAGNNQSITTFGTTLNATATPGYTSYWSPVAGLTFSNSSSPTTLVNGFKPEKSPYILTWNVGDGNEVYSDTVVINVTNIPPSIFVVAKEFIIEKDIAIISLDSLVSDPNQNLASIQIITPFLKLEPRVVQINNENLTITIDLTKSDVNFAAGLADSLEYEICDELNACDRGFIKVLRRGIINLEAFVAVEEIKPSIVYNFLSPNNDQLNGNFFFDIIMKKTDSSEVPISIVTDNNSSGFFRNGVSFEDFFKNHVERIQVVIFNRWGDVVDSYEDYFGGQAFTNGKITGDQIEDNYVWKGKDKNGNNLTPGTYYFYIKLFNKNIDDYSTNGFIELRN